MDYVPQESHAQVAEFLANDAVRGALTFNDLSYCGFGCAIRFRDRGRILLHFLRVAGAEKRSDRRAAGIRKRMRERNILFGKHHHRSGLQGPCAQARYCQPLFNWPMPLATR